MVIYSCKLSQHFLPAPQDLFLPASLFVPLDRPTSLIAPQIRNLLTCARL